MRRKVGEKNLCSIGDGVRPEWKPLWVPYYRAGDETLGLDNLRNSSGLVCFVL